MSIPWSARWRAAGTDERGSALVGVLLLLLMMTALAATLGINAQTETLISSNQRSAAQAQAAAEAGLNHAIELVSTYIFQWQPNQFNSAETAIDSLLTGPDGLTGTAQTNEDNTSLGARVGIDAAAAIPLGTRLTIAGGINAEYEAFIMDDDADAQNENGDPLTDANETLIVRAIGYAKEGVNESKVVLEALLSPIPLPAVASNGDLDISGNVEINGAVGSAHTNGNIEVSGSVKVTGNTTASGTYDGPDTTDVSGSGGATPVSVPEIHSMDYLNYADFILTSAGKMTNQAGTVLCTWSNKTPCNAWNFDGGSGKWSLKNTPTAGTYYVEGSVDISGNTGTPGNPAQITVIANGSININGGDFIPDTSELLFVTDGDLDMTGNPTTYSHGQILVREQIRLSGSPDLDAQIIVENVTSVDDLVTTNSIGGNVEITYNGGLGTSHLVVSGWRDVRQ